MKQKPDTTLDTIAEMYGDPLGINGLVKAKTKDELVKAFETSREVFQDLYDHHSLIELQDLAKKMDSGERDDDIGSKFIEKQQQVMWENGVLNGKTVEGSVTESYQRQVRRLRKQLITEHQANTASEFMLIDLAINAYYRSLHSARLYSYLAQNKDGTVSFNQPRINMMKELEKQIDSANRQYLSTLTLLKELKQPQINIKVQSKQAFVGQNQQFNKNA